MAVLLGRTQQAWRSRQVAQKRTLPHSPTNFGCTVGTWSQAAQMGHRIRTITSLQTWIVNPREKAFGLAERCSGPISGDGVAHFLEDRQRSYSVRRVCNGKSCLRLSSCFYLPAGQERGISESEKTKVSASWGDMESLARSVYPLDSEHRASL